MKKFFCILSLLVLSTSFVACSNKSNGNNSISISSSSSKEHSIDESVTTQFQSGSLTQKSQTVSSSGTGNLTSSESHSSSATKTASTSSSQSQPIVSGNNFADGESFATQTAKTAIENVINSFELYRNNTISRSALSLPRVSDSGLVYIDWKSSNESIINTFGIVNQTDKEQSVELTAKFYVGESFKTKKFNLTVSKKQTSQPITESDARILKKVYVSNASELSSAFSSAKAGDAIILNDGVYSGFSKQLTASGTSKNPIFILAKNNSKAVFSGATQMLFKGNFICLSGVVFKDGSPASDDGAVVFKGSNCRMTECLVYNFEKEGEGYKWLSLFGADCEIDKNEFDTKTVGGALLTVWRDEPVAQYHYIHDNVFKNYTKGTGNGFETIRLGDSEYSQSNAYCVIENNLFENLNGEIEIVSVKSGRNAIVGNTFVSCGGLLTFRHGKNNLAANNVFLGNDNKDSGGVRMYDGGHVVFNNFVRDSLATADSRGGIVLHSGVNKVGELAVVNKQWTAYNCLIQSNTLVNCEQCMIFCKKYDYPAQDISIKDNVLISSGNAVRDDGAISFAVSKNNLVYASKIGDKSNQIEGFILKNGSAIPTNNGGKLLEFEAGAKNLKVIDYANVGNTTKVAR